MRFTLRLLLLAVLVVAAWINGYVTAVIQQRETTRRLNVLEYCQELQRQTIDLHTDRLNRIEER